MKISELKIDPDFKNLLPPLDAETYTDLEKDIVANGLFDPIIIWNGFIADGHNRYEICKAHRIEEVQTKELNKSTKSEVMQWIYDHQFARRNLLKSEKVRSLAAIEEEVAREAEQRMKAGVKNPTVNLPQGVEEKKRNPTTSEQMAKKLGVSDKTFRDMKLVVESGTEKQIARMDKGGIGNGVSTIAREIRDGVNEGERKCIRCGKIKAIELFTCRKNPYVCKDCEDKRKAESRDRLNGLSEIAKVTEILKQENAPQDKGDTSAKREVEFLINNFKSAVNQLMVDGKKFDIETMIVITEFAEYLKSIRGENYEERELQPE